jgi:hypothetical protein
MLRFVVLCAVSFGLGGCADARGRFDAFEERRGSLDDDGSAAGAAGADGLGGATTAGASGCAPPTPGEVHGPALLALDTVMAPGVAIMFWGELETPALDGGTAVKFTYRALDAADRRTEVGEELIVGPVRIGDDGAFDAGAPRAELPGSANAILPGIAIDSELELHGTICGAQKFYCGAVSGQTYKPLVGPAKGHFGITLLDSKSDMPAQPRFGCAEDALSPALDE